MSKIDVTYFELLDKVKKEGYKYLDPNRSRQEVFRIELPKATIVHNFEDGFPVLSTKKMPFKTCVKEFLWMLNGSNDIRHLWDKNVRIWDEDWWNYVKRRLPQAAKEMISITNAFTSYKRDPDKHSAPELHHRYLLGAIYGPKLRRWTSQDGRVVDQLTQLVKKLRSNPMTTNTIVTHFDPSETLDTLALPPCHWSFEILTKPDRTFVLNWHQRSTDVFLGLPFNIVYYSLMAYVIGYLTGLRPTGIIGDLSRVHIYELHMNAVNTQLSQPPKKYNSETELVITEDAEKILSNVSNMFIKDVISKLDVEDFNLTLFSEGPKISATMLSYDK